jgi:hypothetical protein
VSLASLYRRTFETQAEGRVGLLASQVRTALAPASRLPSPDCGVYRAKTPLPRNLSESSGREENRVKPSASRRFEGADDLWSIFPIWDTHRRYRMYACA